MVRWWLGSNGLAGDDGGQVIWDESSILSMYSLLVDLIRCSADPYPCRVDRMYARMIPKVG